MSKKCKPSPKYSGHPFVNALMNGTLKNHKLNVALVHECVLAMDAECNQIRTKAHVRAVNADITALSKNGGTK